MATEYAVDDLNSTHDTPSMGVGTVVKATDGKDYMYVKNNSATTTLTAYYVVALETFVSQNGEVVVATAADAYSEIGVMHTSLDPSSYGFACVRGIHTAHIAALDTVGLGLVAGAAGALVTVANGATNIGAQCPRIQLLGTASDPLVRML